MTSSDHKQATLVYIGPPGQESPLLGPLVAGRRYQVDVGFAAYLAETHPTYWQRPEPVAPPLPSKE